MSSNTLSNFEKKMLIYITKVIKLIMAILSNFIPACDIKQVVSQSFDSPLSFASSQAQYNPLHVAHFKLWPKVIKLTIFR